MIATLAAGAAACAGGNSGAGPSVIAAFYPLAYAAERIAPEARVRNLTPPGAEPHDLELSPRDVEAITSADVVLYLGSGFMPALEDAAKGRANAFDLLEGETLLVSEGVHGRDDEGEETADDDAPEIDPHLWLDPRRYAVLARRVADAVDDPPGADQLIAELERLDVEYRDGLATCERRQIVTSHAAFAYLAAAYELEQVPLAGISPETEPSARAIEALVDEVKEEGATTVFFETLVSPRLARTIAREAGARTAVLNPLEGLTRREIEDGADYFSVMRENLATLREALGCT